MVRRSSLGCCQRSFGTRSAADGGSDGLCRRERRPHGVGSRNLRCRTLASPLPDGPRYDPQLLRDGDTRNVVDAYRYWTREAIVADIDTRRHPLHVAIMNFGHDANIGGVVCTANAFAVDTVHIVGRRRWNRSGAMVTDRYQRLRHRGMKAELLAFADEARLTVVGVDNVPSAAPGRSRHFRMTACWCSAGRAPALPTRPAPERPSPVFEEFEVAVPHLSPACW